MLSTVEGTHHKILNKINNICKSGEQLQKILYLLDQIKTCDLTIMTMRSNALATSAENLLTDYRLSVVGILSNYYRMQQHNEEINKNYYKIITTENFVSRVDELVKQAEYISLVIKKIIIDAKWQIHEYKPCSDSNNRDNNVILTNCSILIDEINSLITSTNAIIIAVGLNQTNYDTCECGAKRVHIPELSELRCSSSSCGLVKIIVGCIFKEDQYASDTQKSKCNGYDFGRHFKFWMERLQALEHKIFNEGDLARIKECIVRDRTLNCEITCVRMRGYLKELNLTEYNDHVPLLVKMFGGYGPPQYDFQETRDIAIKFNKIINLYHKVNPNGSNRPYYPFFIYKIVEHKFRDNPEKLRLLDYIHLQSDDTIKKNDSYYEKICALASPEDGLIYSATNPYDRL
jgi:hypothetical protein